MITAKKKTIYEVHRRSQDFWLEKRAKPIITRRRVARIWKRGGLFWKSENSANDLNPNFCCSWISITRFVGKLRRNFWESSEIQTFLPPKNRRSPKNKRSSPKLRLIFRPKSEIPTFFPPKNRWFSKKKVFTEIETDFSPKIGNSNAFSDQITTFTSQLWHSIFFGGAVFNFLPKIGLKSTKNVRFCILDKPMGGLEPPAPPGYTTDHTQWQRWSRGRKARGQGQGHQKNSRPRTAFPRTEPLEAKNRNARGQDQGPKTVDTGASVLKK